MKPADGRGNAKSLRLLTYLMFMMFAMTTDSAGVIIPEVVRAYHLSLTEGGAFHYASMTGIALAGLGLGFLADRIGRKATIITGLVVFGVAAGLFVAGDGFLFFVCLLFIAGAAIGVFKTGALALVGDLTSSGADHTRTMNLIEGFFGVGAIIGPAVVTQLLLHGVSWRWLYAGAGCLAMVLAAIALSARYPARREKAAAPARFSASLRMMSDAHVLGFSAAAMLYVGVEAGVYVWLPSLLAGYRGSLATLVLYALPLFFALRAVGRFVGSFLLARLSWPVVLAVSTGAVLVCFIASQAGQAAAAIALPVSGLFMSVIYPTINSKGISCFPKREQGAVSGVILFFTCLGAVLAPLAMGWAGDHFGGPAAGFALAAGLAAMLFLAALGNAVANPSRARLERVEAEAANEV